MEKNIKRDVNPRRLNTVPYKVYYTLCGNRHVKGFKTREQADGFAEIMRGMPLSGNVHVEEKFV